MSWRKYVNSVLAKQVSGWTKYSSITVQLSPLPFDSGELFENLDCSKKEKIVEVSDLAIYKTSEEPIAVILNGNFNHTYDAQKLLQDIKSNISRFSRVILIAYNPYFGWLYRVASSLKIRKGPLPTTFLTRTDLKNICTISGFDVCALKPCVYFPFKFLFVGPFINRLMSLIPFVNLFSLTSTICLRPIISDDKPRSLTVVIPARNESGNIENALKRMPRFAGDLEIIFIEGNSTDDTWEEIQRVQKKYSPEFNIKIGKQSGKGKADAVRKGFSMASGQLLSILDADLTMPPELLPRFYNAYTEGAGDFINGTRLVYPMEGEAMRFLNLLGNIFFAKALSYVLGVRLGDSLCGTKLVSKHDYNRMISWRKDFGDFDPFGDFELLFPAATLGLGIVDIPIRYRDRTYGTTNISRFRHGFQLLRMTLIGFFRIKV